MQTEAMATEVASTIKLTTMSLAQLLAPGIAKIKVLNPVPEEMLVHSRCAHLHTDMKNKCVCVNDGGVRKFYHMRVCVHQSQPRCSSGEDKSN